MHAMRVPRFICRILKSYFENRLRAYDTAEGKQSRNILAAVLQGSIWDKHCGMRSTTVCSYWRYHEEHKKLEDLILMAVPEFQPGSKTVK